MQVKMPCRLQPAGRRAKAQTKLYQLDFTLIYGKSQVLGGEKHNGKKMENSGYC